MTTHGLPEKLTTTNRCTSRSSTARFFSRGLSNGAEESNVAEALSGALLRHVSARAMHESREGMAASSTSQAATTSRCPQFRLPYRVKLLSSGHSCYRSRRTGGRKR
ncbi:hypothetical protein FIBSPDRAFT_853814 [Athelia psychrophila]|uniref:Uncharacterized protein n=1 Tax=Athelia psychrophila TaxID=1759441 RepID=A0A166QHM1_9AGAM|nr:hypothetical protein FIBSPDRAFT_866864 [Fibularhizoctonia sp. CBS 109695]KZP27153.1 hypothetical protein FIBSPDRAFT_853814 [Fibularhizoctonia sp. CBS 109695]